MTMEEMLIRYPFLSKFNPDSAEMSLRVQVISVAEDVEAAAAYDRGEHGDVDDEDDVDNEDDVDDEEHGLAAYFADPYDVEFTVGLSGGGLCYEGVKVAVAIGGPSIYVDTNTNEVRGVWWGDEFCFGIDAQACRQIDELFEELFDSYR